MGVGPYETVTISGWQTSQTDARRLSSQPRRSRTVRRSGRQTNLGTISAAFFRERVGGVASDASIEVHESLRRAERSAPAQERRRRRRARASAAGEPEQARKAP